MEGTTTTQDAAKSQFEKDYAAATTNALLSDSDIECFIDETTSNLPNCWDFDRFAKHMRV